MRKIIIKSLLVLLLIINLQMPGFGNTEDIDKYLLDNVVSTRLSNGINVVLLHRGFFPTITLITSFKVGSVDESYKTIGMAHMLEHMLFKGTDRIGTKDFKKEKKILSKITKTGENLDKLRLINPTDKKIPILEQKLKDLQRDQRKYTISSPYDKIYTAKGGVGFNASTSKDITSYIIELPSSKIELWASTESERLRKPVMREFYLERSTVLEERLMRYESKGISNLIEKFIAVAFIAHPYRHPIIGWMSNIEHFSMNSVKKFYKTNYIPSRMTITVVGWQNTDKTLKLLEKYFGNLKPGDDPPEIVIKEPKQKGERRININFKSNPYLIIGWHKPTFPSRDNYIADMISGILSYGKSSRLYKILLLEKQIVASVDSWNGFPGERYDNLFIITATPKHPYTTEDVEKAIHEEIERLKIDLKEEELKRVLNRLEASLIFDLDSNKGVAKQLNYFQTNYGDWKYLTKYLDNLKKINTEDIKKFISRYFTKENRTVGILINSNDIIDSKN